MTEILVAGHPQIVYHKFDALLSTVPYMIFISYAQKDGLEYAKRLEKALQETGFETWRDEPDIHPASGIDVAIEDAILQADSVIVCITKDVQRTDSFVRREIPYAEALKKPIIVVRFEDVLPPITVFNRNWLNFFKMAWGDAVEELCAWLKRPLRDRQKSADDTSKPIDSRPADPFRPYLEAALKSIVDGLRQRIIEPIELKVGDTPDAVSIAVPKRSIFERAFSGARMGGENPEKREFTTFSEGFEAYQGRVLLLGEPGAGKTVTLMDHARDAYSARLEDPTKPLPLFNLVPTWDSEKQTALHEWIAEVHGLDADAVKREIEAGRTLLLFDGLDELGSERHERKEVRDKENVEVVEFRGKLQVRKETNDDSEPVYTYQKYDPRLRFLQGLQKLPASNQILLTSRTQEYRLIDGKAALNGAITLQPLDDNQMSQYLRDQPELLTLLKSDPQLRELTRTPLLMSLFAFAYRDLPKEERLQLTALTNTYELREKIFVRYVNQRYEHERTKINADLPFSLDELKQILGRLAIGNTIGTYGYAPDFSEEAASATERSAVTHLTINGKLIKYEQGRRYFTRGNVLSIADLERHISLAQIPTFVELAVRLNLLAQADDETFRFIHLLLRDTLAFHIALRDINDANAFIRRNAVICLARLQDGRAVNPLIRALQDVNNDVRYHAAEALGGFAAPVAATALIRTLEDDEALVRFSAAKALGRIGDPSAIDSLIRCLNDVDLSVRVTASFALGAIGLPAVDGLIRVLSEGTAFARSRAADILGIIGSPQAVDALMQARNDTNGHVRMFAKKSLKKLRRR